MMNTAFLRKLVIFSLIISLASCDKDFNTIGSDVIGDENFTTKPEFFTVKAYNQKVGAVETGNLLQNQLGILANRNPILGTTTSDFVTTLDLAVVKPIFTSGIAIDSVVLTIPYFSTKTSGTATTNGTYTLNGIYTTNTTSSFDPIDLKVYRNGFFLRDTDPATSAAQKHFSNEGSIFNSFKIGSVLNNSVLSTENSAFIPDTKEFRTYKVVNNLPTTEIETRNSPRIRLHLDTTEFLNTIINPAITAATKINFETKAAFKNYYKGLYFKTTQIGSKGTSMLLDFTQGNVTIYYKQDKVVNVPTAREMKSIVLNMTGNTVNLFNNSEDPIYTAAVTNPNVNPLSNGNKKLYLKGGSGAFSYIELFSQAELDNLRSQKLLINEASLTFTADNTSITSDYFKPRRIYIFNADDNTPVFDYFFDNSTNTTDLSLNKFIHDGIFQSGSGGKDKYRIRITEHVNNIIKRGSKNVRLGIIVTENINLITTSNLLDEISAPSIGDTSKKLSKIPTASITNRFGTVLFGTDYSVGDANYADRLKFEIYYTKPN